MLCKIIIRNAQYTVHVLHTVDYINVHSIVHSEAEGG